MITIQTPKSYNGSDTGDIRAAVRHILQKENSTLLFGIGYSLGANLLTKWIGEEGKDCPLLAAVSVSNPFDFNAATHHWQGWRFHHLLGKHLTRFLKRTIFPLVAIQSRVHVSQGNKELGVS